MKEYTILVTVKVQDIETQRDAFRFVERAIEYEVERGEDPMGVIRDPDQYRVIEFLSIR